MVKITRVDAITKVFTKVFTKVDNRFMDAITKVFLQKYCFGITVSVDSLSCDAILGFTKAKSETQWSLRVTVVTAGTVGTVDKRWSGKFYAVSQPSCGKSQSTLPVLSLGKGSQNGLF